MNPFLKKAFEIDNDAEWLILRRIRTSGGVLSLSNIFASFELVEARKALWRLEDRKILDSGVDIQWDKPTVHYHLDFDVGNAIHRKWV